MIFVYWLVCASASVAMSILAWLLAPAIVLFAKKDGYLPRCLSLFGQEDNSLDGDDPWRDATAHPTVNRMPKYIRRILWLWRNPAQVFDAKVAATVSSVDVVRVFGDDLVSDQPYFKAGYCYATVGKFWMLYVCLPTFPGMCCRIYCGWKLMDFLHVTRPDVARLTIGCNPFMTRGKSTRPL
ncbi:hypothetical protein UFOVP150_21 [uncultured Caudovirales phage]|uniref:Uncharacterized protein n=1 Tax=uncultured Caudovirales phage TaxID=2100421 RepID=A0A6J7W9Z5_9CAUD|nr:hypothetical protein UFOVP150_21 [uncultured Caudovirales phage]